MEFLAIPGGAHFELEGRSGLGTYIKLADGFIQDGKSSCFIHYPGEGATRHPFNAINYDGTPSVFEPDKKCTLVVPPSVQRNES